jgi:hypothetical protein
VARRRQQRLGFKGADEDDGDYAGKPASVLAQGPALKLTLIAEGLIKGTLGRDDSGSVGASRSCP